MRHAAFYQTSRCHCWLTTGLLPCSSLLVEITLRPSADGADHQSLLPMYMHISSPLLYSLYNSSLQINKHCDCDGPIQSHLIRQNKMRDLGRQRSNQQLKRNNSGWFCFGLEGDFRNPQTGRRDHLLHCSPSNACSGRNTECLVSPWYKSIWLHHKKMLHHNEILWNQEHWRIDFYDVEVLKEEINAMFHVK